jgi:hypothetical protein
MRKPTGAYVVNSGMKRKTNSFLENKVYSEQTV